MNEKDLRIIRYLAGAILLLYNFFILYFTFGIER